MRFREVGSRDLIEWEPVVTSSAVRAAATDAIDAVVHAAVSRREGRVPEHDALMFAYLSLARRDSGLSESASERVNEAIDAASEARHMGLHGGLAGLGWIVEHIANILDVGELSTSALAGNVAELDVDDPVSEIDAAILRQLQRHPPGSWTRPFDLVSGLVGYGIYFLERLPRANSKTALRLILDHLDALVEQAGPGLTWRRHRESGPASPPAEGENDYDLGVAHGIPGVMYLLDQLSAVGLESDRADRLVAGAFEWLTAQKRPHGSRSWFSPTTSSSSTDSRLGWCYGDLGVAVVLTDIAHRAKNQKWRLFATQLVEHCLARPLEYSGVEDAGLCHGAAGNAHMFGRLYRTYGDLRYRDAASMWIERALCMWQPGRADGGFVTLVSEPGALPSWGSSAALLDGSVGVALALLSATESVQPEWDRLLLLSTRSGAPMGQSD
jgi:hypothetical protein